MTKSATQQEELPDEIWKRAPGYPGYSVSNFGRLRDEPRRTYRLGSSTAGDGYYRRAGLINEAGERKMISVHILVAEAFIGPRNPLLFIDHLDDDPANAAAANLQYLTHSQNQRKRSRKR